MTTLYESLSDIERAMVLGDLKRPGVQRRFFALLANGLSEVRKAMRIGTPGMSKASRRLFER
jgi:hypothetical protein